jgi:hypothetical protein
MKKKMLGGVMLALVIAWVGWRIWEPVRTPAVQPPLTVLTVNNIDLFRRAFNDASGSVRLVLLLSPT